MSRNSRSYAGAALLTAWLAIPATAQAQTSAAERSLMNQVGPALRGQIGVQQLIATGGAGEQMQASQALQGTVGAIRLPVSETGAADAAFPTAEQALLGQVTRARTRKEN